MNIIRNNKLHYSKDFIIACRINNLKPAALLQYFIEHISFYSFLGAEMEPIYLWATRVVTDCTVQPGNHVTENTNPAQREIALKYIKLLTTLLFEEGVDKAAETEKSIVIMKNWAADMAPYKDYPQGTITSSGNILHFSFDLNLICSLKGLTVPQVLQAFINDISLAADRGKNLFQNTRTTPAMTVLLLLLSSHEAIRDKILPHQHIYREFGLRLLEIDKILKEEPGVQQRIDHYDIFYHQWYTALQLADTHESGDHHGSE
jgi:hypothetical protein